MICMVELNENNIAIGLKMVKSEINDHRHVRVDEMDEDILWRKYENGQWSDEKFPTEDSEQGMTLGDKVNYLYYKEMGYFG